LTPLSFAMFASPSSNPGILFVDDERKALTMFEKAFSHRFEVRTASSAEEAIRLLEKDESAVSVVITDQRMPQRTGINFLKEVQERFPDKIRLLTTAYTDVDTLVGAINEGSVYRFVSKPWDLQSLGEEIAEAIKSYDADAEERALLTRRVEELQDAVLDEKVAEIGSVAVSLSHYVDNALCPFDLLISKLSERLGESERDRSFLEFLERIRDHIRSTSENISQLRLVNFPLEADRLARVNLGELCEECLKRDAELISSKNIHFELNRSDQPAWITGDRNRLKDFFHFMVAEEVVSSGKDSRVGISVRTRSDAMVEVSIEDETPLRPGVSPGDFLYPFNVRNANPRNFGVFLICAFFHVRCHGGEMKADRSERGGMRFTFSLPVHPSI